jgi:hypothetical protein
MSVTRRRFLASLGTAATLRLRSAPSLASKPRLLRKDCFFGIHLDLHPAKDDTVLGHDVTESMIESFLASVKPDYVQYDCKGHVRGLFGTTDECKPIDGGQKVLITSSGGGVAVVEREKSRVTFYGRAANAHSADFLPGNRIAVAASRDPRGRGDRLVIFDLARSDQPLWSEELPSGHGAVWDAQRQTLWALADEDIRAYRLRDWETPEPKLERVLAISLPEGGGHDLYPVSGTAHLTVTTTNHCWLFDRDTRTFVLHPMLAEFRHVKSISIHPVTRQLVYVQAEGENWWAERLRFLNPEWSLYTRGEHHYKARWMTR